MVVMAMGRHRGMLISSERVQIGMPRIRVQQQRMTTCTYPWSMNREGDRVNRIFWVRIRGMNGMLYRCVEAHDPPLWLVRPAQHELGFVERSAAGQGMIWRGCVAHGRTSEC